MLLKRQCVELEKLGDTEKSGKPVVLGLSKEKSGERTCSIPKQFFPLKNAIMV